MGKSGGQLKIIGIAVIVSTVLLFAYLMLTRPSFRAVIVFDVTVKRIVSGGKRDIHEGQRCELRVKLLEASTDAHLAIVCDGSTFLQEDDTSFNLWEDEADGAYYYRITGRDGVGHGDHVRRGFTIDSHRQRMFMHPVFSRLDVTLKNNPKSWFIEWEMPRCSRPREGAPLLSGSSVRLTGSYHLGDPDQTFLFQSPPRGLRCPESSR